MLEGALSSYFKLTLYLCISIDPNCHPALVCRQRNSFSNTWSIIK